MPLKQNPKKIEGKICLVGLTFLDYEGNLIEHYQTHGKIIELTEDELLIIERTDNSIFQLPYDKDSIVKAEEGDYTLTATNEVIADPDFLISWEIAMEDTEEIENMKTFGYIPPDEDEEFEDEE